MATYTYNPDVFRVPDERAAKNIILTREGWDTDLRWANETPYLADLLGEQLRPQAGQLLVDYGCGLGRMAKALIERFGVRVLGVDISVDMRRLAPPHVASEDFSVVSVPVFRSMVDAGLRADGALSVWVIQHALTPADDLDLLRGSLKPGGGLFIVNNIHRAVPTREGPWASDGLDIRAMLGERFAVQAEGALDAAKTGEAVHRWAFWAAYRA